MQTRPLLIATAASLISLGGGVVLGYKIAERNLALRFEERMLHETENLKEFYQQASSTKKAWSTPEEAAADLIKSGTVLSETSPLAETEETKRDRVAYNKIVQDKNYSPKDDEVTDPEDEMALEIMFPKSPPEEIVRNNVFSNQPHVLSQEEFIENDSNWNQSTLTWYVVDKVLSDERDQVIEEVDGTVGSDNLLRFGEGSSDDNIVHIRNPRLQLEFEVVRHEGSYAREVLGIDEDPPQRPSGRS